MVKATWLPNGYTRNQTISDAVLLKPAIVWPTLKGNMHASLGVFPLQKKDDTLFLGDKQQCVLIGGTQSTDYKGFRFQLGKGE